MAELGESQPIESAPGIVAFHRPARVFPEPLPTEPIVIVRFVEFDERWIVEPRRLP